MNYLASTAKLLTISFALAAGLVSCDGNKATTASTPVTDAATSNAPATINIRYIDSDSIATRYNLAKDFQEVTLRAYSKLDAARQSKANAIQNLAGQIQEKVQNNGYLSETSYNSDMTKLNRMQQDAEQSLASMQRSTEQELAQLQQAMNDSIIRPRATMPSYSVRQVCISTPLSTLPMRLLKASMPAIIRFRLRKTDIKFFF